MKKIVLFSMLAAGLFMNTLSAQIVFQSDFETWTGAQAVNGWDGSKTNIVATPDSARKDSLAPYHGSYCVRLVNTTTSTKRFSTQPIAVTGGTLYSVRFWVKGNGSIRTGLSGVKFSTGFGYMYNSYVAIASGTWGMVTQYLVADSTNANAQFLFSVKSTIEPSSLSVDSVTIRAVSTVPVETLYAIQYTTAVPANSPFMNQYVTTGGIVTAVYNGSTGTQSGYYVQSTNAHAWSAVNVYDYNHIVSMGDSITFTGQVQEYYNETEIANVNNFTKVSTGNPVPTPTVVAFNNIQNEMYEGMLIKAKDISDVRYNATSAWYVFADSTGGLDTVDNVIYTYPGYTVGKKYTITGVIHFEYANWIEPRNIGDIDSIHVSAGIREYQNDLGLSVYPNPNNGIFTVSMNVTGDAQKMDVVLTDITGRIIYREELDAHSGQSTLELNTAGIAKGTYFLALSNTQSRSVSKVIVQ
jgi:hypothetical protein